MTTIRRSAHAGMALYRAPALVIGALMLIAVAATPARGGDVNTGYFGKVAIQGYDPVAYFIKGKAMTGSESYRLKWLGAYWHFASAEHRALFAADPQRYAPQYGGYCATGLAIRPELTRDIDPEAWAIIDDKLYLNYSKETNTLLTNGLVSLARADENWKKVNAE